MTLFFRAIFLWVGMSALLIVCSACADGLAVKAQEEAAGDENDDPIVPVSPQIPVEPETPDTSEAEPPSDAEPEAPSSYLDPSLVWYGDNAARLNAFIAETGTAGDNYDASRPPVAVFDWDNTVIKNDVGDAVLFWMLRTNKVKLPPQGDWTLSSPHLTAEAITALAAACGIYSGTPCMTLEAFATMPSPQTGTGPEPQSSPSGVGQPHYRKSYPLCPPAEGAESDVETVLTTDGSSEASRSCADEIVSIYSEGRTHSGQAAWKTGSETDVIEPAYAWAVSLQQGYTPAQLVAFAQAAIDEALAAPIDAVQVVGSGEYAASLRIYKEIADLIAALGRTGFQVWVVSASSEPIVATFAGRVGIGSDRVIGVRALVDAAGKTTPYFAGCGSYADGTQEIIPYKQGKRCWINKVIGAVTDAAQMLEGASEIAFAAGDSDTDLFFLRDSSGLRLVINRNKPELMCHAYENADGNWLVNPMFICPKAERLDPYSCAEWEIADQPDSVYGVYGCE